MDVIKFKVDNDFQNQSFIHVQTSVKIRIIIKSILIVNKVTVFLVKP